MTIDADNHPVGGHHTPTTSKERPSIPLIAEEAVWRIKSVIRDGVSEMYFRPKRFRANHSGPDQQMQRFRHLSIEFYDSVEVDELVEFDDTFDTFQPSTPPTSTTPETPILLEYPSSQGRRPHISLLLNPFHSGLAHPVASVKWQLRNPRFWINAHMLATAPPQTRIRITMQSFPWIIVINASNWNKGISIWDIQRQIHSFLMVHTPRAEFEAQSDQQQGEIEKSFWNNRSAEVRFPDIFQLGPGLRRFDWLGKYTTVGGLVVEDRAEVLERLGSHEDDSPVLKLLCVKNENAETNCESYGLVYRLRLTLVVPVVPIVLTGERHR